MLNFEPNFVMKPDPWVLTVTFHGPFERLELAPEKVGTTRVVELGCSYHNLPLCLRVPAHWTAEQVSMAVSRFRATYR